MIGLDLTDTQLLFLELSEETEGLIPTRHGEVVFPVGTLVNGKLRDEKTFLTLLKELRKKHNIKTGRIATGEDMLDPQVAQAFKRSGIVVDAEHRSYSLARTLPETHETTLFIDINETQTIAMIIVTNMIVHAARLSTGSDHIATAISDKLALSPTVVAQLLQREGFDIRKTLPRVYTALLDELADMIEKINEFLVDVQKDNAFPRTTRVQLGGSLGVMPGLRDYVAGALRLPTTVLNPWENCFSFDNHIPDLNKEASARYEAAIGAALGAQE